MSLIESTDTLQTAQLDSTDFRLIKGSIQNRDLLTHVESLYKRARDRRQTFERQWYLNMAFYFGRQYAQWVAATTSTSLTRLYEPPAPSWRVRLVVNKVRKIVRKELSKVTQENPRGFVIPSSSDDDDLAAAQAGDAIFEHLWRDLVMAKTIRRAEFWTLLLGSGFIKDYYEPDKEDSSGIKGAICAEAITPFHILVPDLHEEEIENQPYVIHLSAKTPEYVKKVFGKVVEPDSGAMSGALEQKFLSALGLDTSAKNYVTVKELWIKANARFPKGALITWAGDEILQFIEKWPYAHNQYPFTKLDHIPTGRFYADSTIVDLIPLQKEYNRSRSQIIESKNRMAKPQLIAPRGSIDPRKVTSEPGLIIFYTPGFEKPVPLPLQNLPAYVIEDLRLTQSDIEDVSSHFGFPPGIHAATAISYVQEQDDSVLTPTISSLEEGVEKLGRHFLSYVQQYWNAQRQIRVIGENNQYEAFQLSKADIKGNLDFRVEAGSATPRSRAAKQAFIMELGKMGWIPPDRALRYLDMAETGKLYEEMQINARQAQRENLQMANGQQVPVNSWDDDLAHIDEHDTFRKKQSFEFLDPQLQAMFEAHVTQHKQKLAAMFALPYPPGPELDGAIKKLMMGGPQALAQIPPPTPGGGGGNGSSDLVPSMGGSEQGNGNALPMPPPRSV